MLSMVRDGKSVMRKFGLPGTFENRTSYLQTIALSVLNVAADWQKPTLVSTNPQACGFPSAEPGFTNACQYAVNSRF